MNNFDFSTTLRHYGEIPRKLLAEVACIHESNLHYYINGTRQPSVETLRRWYAAVSRLPSAFRNECFKAIGKPRDGDLTISIDSNLDADGDGRITVRDARIFDARKQTIAAQRRAHAEEAFSDGVISPEEAALDARLANEEIGLSERGRRVMTRLAEQQG